MKKALPIILIVFILLVVVGSIVYFGFINTPQSVSGYTSLSISNVEIVDNGAKIRIYGVSNGAEQINIDFTPSKLNQYLENKGYSATKSVTGSITLNNPTREFYATKDNEKIFSNIGYYELSLLKSCDNNKPIGITQEVFRIRSTGICAYENSQGVYASFSGKTVDSTPVNVNIGGSTGTLNPSSGNNVLTLNDGKTKIEWVGNLVNYQGLNTPNYALLFSNSEYTKLIRQDSWSSYENTLLDFKTNADIGLFSTSQAKSEINAFNNAFNTILVDKTNDYKNSVNIDGLTFTNNGIKVDLTTPTQFPTFIITLDATKVGIVELKGKPNIVSCVSDKDISSGDTYSTNVKVKNIGSNDGSFYAQLSCSGDSGASGIVSEQYVKAGQTVNLPVQVSGTNTKSGTQDNTCTIKVIDRKSGDSDTCKFILGVKYQQNIICTPNSKTCLDSSTLKICNSKGTSFTTQDCDLGCIVLESGEAQCKGEDETCNLDCKWTQTLKQTESCGGNPLCWVGIVKPKPVCKCVLASWVYLVILAFILAIIVLSLYLKYRR
jgi:hypothetical protein